MSSPISTPIVMRAGSCSGSAPTTCCAEHRTGGAPMIPKGLRGPFKPMRFEATVDDCIVVEGEIPADLNGGFYRNGPTWRRPAPPGRRRALAMDGMIQALILREGRADFRNRWVRTPKYRAEERAGRALFEWSDGGFGDW